MYSLRKGNIAWCYLPKKFNSGSFESIMIMRRGFALNKVKYSSATLSGWLPIKKVFVL